eukprot:TRINITY_DN75156_c0_g1_i1.p1 TRINITY_DN75156_c0_g1~~TRINITY_DN75156_c0_g1_i1.p1  ORF type:complete len:461 (+),score=50.06 TRINITY_DN75156_c0_g1_i1:64-1446(+)
MTRNRGDDVGSEVIAREDCGRILQAQLRSFMLRPPFSLPLEEVVHTLGDEALCPLLEVDPALVIALTSRGDLCMVAGKALPAGRLLLREKPLLATRADPEDSSYNMLLLLASAAKHFDYLKSSVVGLMPRSPWPRAEPPDRQTYVMFWQIVEGLMDMVKVARGANSTAQLVVALRRCFEDLGELDASDISKALWDFFQLHPSKETSPGEFQDHAQDDIDTELVRMTFVFLLNSFARVDSEVHLCRFCALFNHSCEPNAMPEWKTDGARHVIGMRLLRDVQPGEEITFTYMSLHRDPPGSWPVQRRQNFLSQTFAFSCSCSRCMKELGCPQMVQTPSIKDSVTWMPSYHMIWDDSAPKLDQATLVVVVDVSEVWPLDLNMLDIEERETTHSTLEDKSCVELSVHIMRDSSCRSEVVLTVPLQGWHLKPPVRCLSRRRQLHLRLAPRISTCCDPTDDLNEMA